MVVPGVVRVAEPPQRFHTVAKVLARIQAFERAAGDHQIFGIRIARAGVANAAKQSAARVVVRAQHLFEHVASREICVRDDAGDHRLAATALRARRGDLARRSRFHRRSAGVRARRCGSSNRIRRTRSSRRCDPIRCRPTVRRARSCRYRRGATDDDADRRFGAAVPARIL